MIINRNKVDNPKDILDAFMNFRELVLLFYSESPWDFAKTYRWRRLQDPILKLTTAHNLTSYQEATTKGLCNLARAL